MKTTFKITVLVLIVVITQCCNSDVEHIKHNFLSDKELIIPKEDFKNKVDVYNKLMKNHTKINIDTMIDMVRVYNTICNIGITISEYKTYNRLFVEEYSDTIIKKLDAKLSRGMGYHSKKYNIHIGGVLESNSMYELKE